MIRAVTPGIDIGKQGGANNYLIDAISIHVSSG